MEGQSAELGGSSLTLERAEAAKKLIETHYKSYMKGIEERRRRSISAKCVRNFWALFSPRACMLTYFADLFKIDSSLVGIHGHFMEFDSCGDVLMRSNCKV